MDDVHHDLMPTMRECAAEWAELNRELRTASAAGPGAGSCRARGS